MSKIKKQYVATDGSTFDKGKTAKQYQKLLNKKEKKKIKNKCELCGGSGRNPYHSDHISGSQVECPYCGGTGIAFY